MNITELDQFNLSDTLKFHSQLNPRLWDSSEHLHPEVRTALLAIADDFAEFLGVTGLEIQDITVNGSNAAYNYTPQSDIDLHLVVDVPEMNQEVYRELFNAKKYQYNDLHNITIGDSDVELYVQPANEVHISQGIYSVLNDDWISIPRRKPAVINDSSVKNKYQDITARIQKALDSGNEKTLSRIIAKLKTMRSTGLAQHGEFGTDNLVYKMLRNSGWIQKLYDARSQAHSARLSIEEETPEFRYGFGEASYSTPDGVAPTTCMFLNEKEHDDQQLQQFFSYVCKRLKLKNIPELIIHHDPKWSESNASFGAYDPDTHVLNVSTANRHIMDIKRTLAHELAHARQNELGKLGDNSGRTGSAEENEANSIAGILMRDWGRKNPEIFGEGKKPAPKEFRPPPDPTKRQQFTQEYLDNLAKTYSEKHGVPLDMVQHVMKKETGWMPNPSERAYAVSPKYASGLMQIMPQYHKQYGITDPYNPEQSVNAGTQMLRQHLDTFKDPKLALAAYNAGPTAVRKYGGVPPFPETQKYVQDYVPQAQQIKAMPDTQVQPGIMDKITSTGRDIAKSAVDWINRATAPAGLDPTTMKPLKEKKYVPYKGGPPVDDPEINPLRDRLNRGEHPSRIEKDVRKGAGDDVKKIEHELAVQQEVQRQLEREKADLEKKLRQLKSQPQKEPEKERDIKDRIVDVINQITAPPRPFPGQFGADEVQREDAESDKKPDAGTGPSIQGGLNFLRQLQGLTRITRAGAEEELKGAVRDWARAQSPGAPQNPSGQPVKESSGYIPTEKEKNDPRFKMALTVDIKPGETGRQANKMALQTDSQGRPALLRASGKK